MSSRWRVIGRSWTTVPGGLTLASNVVVGLVNPVDSGLVARVDRIGVGAPQQVTTTTPSLNGPVRVVRLTGAYVFQSDAALIRASVGASTWPKALAIGVGGMATLGATGAVLRQTIASTQTLNLLSGLPGWSSHLGGMHDPWRVLCDCRAHDQPLIINPGESLAVEWLTVVTPVATTALEATLEVVLP